MSARECRKQSLAQSLASINSRDTRDNESFVGGGDSFSVTSEKQPPGAARADSRASSSYTYKKSRPDIMSSYSNHTNVSRKPTLAQSLANLNSRDTRDNESLAGGDSFSVASSKYSVTSEKPMDARACRKQSRPDLSRRRGRMSATNNNNNRLNSMQQLSNETTRQGGRDSIWEEDEMGPLDEN